VSVVRECLAYMKEGAVLSEISSIKNQIFGVLQAARKDITYLCIHPMFGPATKRSKIIKNLLIPVRNQAKELAILNSIFPRSEIEVISNPDLHDEYMAVVIGLNDSPELVSSLLRENPYNKVCINAFLAEAENIQELISAKDARATKSSVEAIKTRLSKLTNTDKSYLKFYKAIEYLKTFETQK